MQPKLGHEQPVAARVSSLGLGATWPGGTGQANLPSEQLQQLSRAAVRRMFGGAVRRQEDLVQEVLTRVLCSLADGRFAGRCSLSGWVWVIARNVVADEVRTLARDAHRGSMQTGETEAPIDVERQLEARSILQRVQFFLGEMDPVTTDILRLHGLLGHDLAEVAARMNLSIAATQSRLVRARRLLLHRLKVDGQESTTSRGAVT